MRVFRVHYPPSLVGRVIYIDVRRIFVDRYGGSVAQSCHYVQNVFSCFCHKTLMLQFSLLLNQVGVDNIVIYTCQVNDWHPNVLAPKRMVVVSNQMVLPINSNHPMVVIINGYV